MCHYVTRLGRQGASGLLVLILGLLPEVAWRQKRDEVPFRDEFPLRDEAPFPDEAPFRDRVQSASRQLDEAVRDPQADEAKLLPAVDNNASLGPARSSAEITADSPLRSFARKTWRPMKFDESGAQRSWLDQPFSFAKFGGVMI